MITGCDLGLPISSFPKPNHSPTQNLGSANAIKRAQALSQTVQKYRVRVKGVSLRSELFFAALHFEHQKAYAQTHQNQAKE
jgi:trehalose-6-phosphatase